MKFGISNVFVLCAILLSVDTFAAPVQIVDARDESTLAVRAPPKKAPVVAAPKVVPKPAAVPPVATAPKKAPVVAAPKKAPVATPPKKAPVATPPKKAPVPAAPNKAPVATPPKKTTSKSAGPKSTAAAPKPSAPASCPLRQPAKPTKPKTIKGRVVAATQFHATCKNFAPSIEAATRAGTLTLQPERLYPNEFTWSGGFYVTPDKDKAQLFGATFLAGKCEDKGGVVVMEFTLNQTGLKLKEVAAKDAIKFTGQQSRLGNGIKRFLTPKPPKPAVGTTPAETTPADVPVDENISKDDNPAPAKPVIPLPTPEQLATIIAAGPDGNTISIKKAEQKELLPILVDFQTVDVVAGARPFTNSQEVSIEDAVGIGMPELKVPFNQVVLVTDKATKALRFVGQEDLPCDLAQLQPKLVQRLKEKEAEAAKLEAAEKAKAAKTPA